jgi:hypothetical protein
MRDVSLGSQAAENENHVSLACGSFDPAANVLSTNRPFGSSGHKPLESLGANLDKTQSE